MKKYFLSLFVFSLFFTFSYGQNGIVAYLSYADFSTKENKPFLETYLTVIGNTLKYQKNENGKYQGTVEISIAFVQNDLIKNFKKYNLLSSEIDSLGAYKNNFIDQQRFYLENGEYDMELEIADKNSVQPIFKHKEKISIKYDTETVRFSEIELVESYTPTKDKNILSKSGYDLIPYVSKYYPVNYSKMNFYAELYNVNSAMKEGEKFLLLCFIEDFDTKEKLNSFSNFSKETAAPINSIFSNFSLEKLPTGNYNLCLEARDKENNLLATHNLFFQRSNPQKEEAVRDISNIDLEKTFLKNYKDLDSLIDMLLCLRPISSGAELSYAQNQLRNEDTELMKKYFYSFWQKRNPLQPEVEWLKYKENVDEVNRIFSTSIRTKKGFSTDRGRVYLQYGKPDIRSVNEHEPSSFPYEIWQYNRLASGQTNRRFVFYNPTLGANDYRLIHSDARGEIFDSRWRYRIDERSSLPADQKYNLDNENIYRNDFGRQVDDIYRNPR